MVLIKSMVWMVFVMQRSTEDNETKTCEMRKGPNMERLRLFAQEIYDPFDFVEGKV